MRFLWNNKEVDLAPHPVVGLVLQVGDAGKFSQVFGFEEAVVAYNMHKSCKFPSPDSCQKRFLWTNKEVDLALHLVVGLVL